MRAFYRLLAYIVVIAVAIISVILIENRSLDRLHAADQSSCLRLQLVRDQSNRNSFIIYSAYVNAAKQQGKLAHTVKNPKARKLAHTIQNEISIIAHQITVVAPTDCNLAVNSAASYRFPEPSYVYTNNAEVKLARERLRLKLPARI